jgi:hypothetical protein
MRLRPLSLALLLAALPVLLIACATTRGGGSTSDAFGELSDDPDILMAEARAMLLAERWDWAAPRFEKLLIGKPNSDQERLLLHSGLFLARTHGDSVEAERSAAADFVGAWQSITHDPSAPGYREMADLARRAKLVGVAAELEANPASGGDPASAVLVLGPSEEYFVLSRMGCGKKARGTWKLDGQELVQEGARTFDALDVSCRGGRDDRRFLFEVTLWMALVDAVSQDGPLPDGFSAEDADRIVTQEFQRALSGSW